MSRLSKTLRAVKAIIRSPWLLNHVLADESLWLKHIRRNHSNFVPLPVVDFFTLAPEFSETIDYMSFLDGGSWPTDLALLKTLCQRIPTCSYFEIGTWRGESAANVGQVASECYTLNLSPQQMKDRGYSKAYSDVYAFYSGNNNKITHLHGDSLEFNFAELNKKFDVIFIDGNHTYEYIRQDTQNVFTHLIHDESIVVWHDYGRTPEKIRHEVLAAILDGVPEQYRQNIYQVSNTLCAVYFPEPMPSEQRTTPGKPQKTFRVQLSINNSFEKHP